MFARLVLKKTLSKKVCVSFDLKWRNLSTKPRFVYNESMEAHLQKMERRYAEISVLLSGKDISPKDLATLGKEYSTLGKFMVFIEERNELKICINELTLLESEEKLKVATSDSEEMILLVQSEKHVNESRLLEVEEKLINFLTPRDEDDEKGIVLEVRAGTGGDEASLFAHEIFKMYQKFCLLMNWKWEELSLAKTEIGGFKEAQAQINGDSVYKHLKFESGVHRVQRIPVNDVKIQTSAASVIVMPEAGEFDVEIRPQDLRIDVYRSGGAGGQSVNKTESAVRMTHIPTGVVVCMQDERSQIQNRAKALRYLRARVYDLERMKHLQARSELRSAAHGTGDRSDKIRTYNFPQDRVTDHRASITVPGVERVLNGELLQQIIQALQELDEKDRIEKFLDSINHNKDN